MKFVYITVRLSKHNVFLAWFFRVGHESLNLEALGYKTKDLNLIEAFIIPSQVLESNLVSCKNAVIKGFIIFREANKKMQELDSYLVNFTKQLKLNLI